MKTVSIIGNRPQLMKIIPELADVLIWTGQHYSDALKNAYLGQVEKCGEVVELNETTIEGMIAGIYDFICSETNIDLVTVYGDTDSTLAGSVAVAKEMYKNGFNTTRLAHVEAELRCGNLSLPEERNRIVVDALSCERFDIPTYGDIMQERLWEVWQSEMKRMKPINDMNKWIVTIHRAENSPQETYVDLLKTVMFYVENARIYVHPKHEHLFQEWEYVRLRKLRKAISYLEMLRELWNCEGVVTDSGGLMREAAWLGKKCIVLRDECEFPELVEAGRIKLVGRDEARLREALNKNDWNLKVELENPNTTQKILDHLGIERRFHAVEAENVIRYASL